MEAININANGTFECGNVFKIQMKQGVIQGYINRKGVGTVEVTGEWYDRATARLGFQGLCLRGSGIIDFRSPKISVRNKNDYASGRLGSTKRVNFSVVDDLRGYDDGSMSWNNKTHGIEVINGIVVDVW